jgi:hypothetical protein
MAGGLRNVGEQAVRASRIWAGFALALVCVTDSAVAGNSLQTQELARTPGVVLVVNTIGDKPCDYVTNRLATDLEFFLNSTTLRFRNESETPSQGDEDWPRLIISSISSTTASGCVWTVEASLYAKVEGGRVFAGPYSGSAQLWGAGNLGLTPGYNLTATVSEATQRLLKLLVNDIRAAQRTFAQ